MLNGVPMDDALLLFSDKPATSFAAALEVIKLELA
jgi:hypothetical protein